MTTNMIIKLLVSLYSNPSVYEQSVYEFSRILDAQINTFFFSSSSQFKSQFSLIRAPSSRKPIVVPVGKLWEINFRFTSFRPTRSLGGPD
jgi:hypothetical protein